jgi:hypothetical protein
MGEDGEDRKITIIIIDCQPLTSRIIEELMNERLQRKGGAPVILIADVLSQAPKEVRDPESPQIDIGKILEDLDRKERRVSHKNQFDHIGACNGRCGGRCISRASAPPQQPLHARVIAGRMAALSIAPRRPRPRSRNNTGRRN